MVALPQLLDVVAGFGEDPTFALGEGMGRGGELGSTNTPPSLSLTLQPPRERVRRSPLPAPTWCSPWSSQG